MVTTTLGELVSVGLGEIQVSRDESKVLTAFGLGSCVAVCAYDSAAKVGGMVHVVLPDGEYRATQDGLSGKYATTGVPLLIESMERLGANRKRMVVKIAGGARMVALTGALDRFEIGERNIRAVKTILFSQRLKLAAEDTGGRCGRTVQLLVMNGDVLVRTAGGAQGRL